MYFKYVSNPALSLVLFMNGATFRSYLIRPHAFILMLSFETIKTIKVGWVPLVFCCSFCYAYIRLEFIILIP